MAIKNLAKLLAVSAITITVGVQESSACGDPFDMVSLANPQLQLQMQRGSSSPAPASRYSSRLTQDEKEKFRSGTAANETVRPAAARRLAAAQKLIDKGEWHEALDVIAKVEASAGQPTPYETYAIAALRAPALAGTGDSLGAAKAYEAVLDARRLPLDRQLQLSGSVAVTYFLAKDYRRAVIWVRRYAKDGGTDKEILSLVPKAYYLAGHYRNAAHESSVLIAATRAAGQQPADELLKLWSSSVALS
ncbi:MAG: hypothetical protein ACT4QA_15815 [Panacagrimonas sp.]